MAILPTSAGAGKRGRRYDDEYLGDHTIPLPIRPENRDARSAVGAEPITSEAVSNALPRGSARSGAKPRAAPRRPPARGRLEAPCASALLRCAPTDEVRFLPAAFEAARREPIPECARKFLAPGMQRLVCLCVVLQRAALAGGDKTFPLSCRVVGKFLGLNPGVAWRWLGALQHAGVIFCTKPGSLPHGSKMPGEAAEYVYLGEGGEA